MKTLWNESRAPYSLFGRIHSIMNPRHPAMKISDFIYQNKRKSFKRYIRNTHIAIRESDGEVLIKLDNLRIYKNNMQRLQDTESSNVSLSGWFKCNERDEDENG